MYHDLISRDLKMNTPLLCQNHFPFANKHEKSETVVLGGFNFQAS